MKPFPLYYIVASWLTLTFGLVTMANPLVPRSNFNLVSNFGQLNQLKTGDNYYHKSLINPITNQQSKSLIIKQSNQIDLSSSSSNHQKCPECHENMMNNRKAPSRLKRSAMLLNKIVSALHKAMDNNNKNSRSNRVYVDSYQSSLSSSQQMDLTRRTGSKKMFRKCYFNPVACF
ncbi:uncharacterized protein LOC128389608 [Panonychus citri]|uniref:uncharacterized protein LOC128389608 n=1 Tax=Panonychus citri TaxID=50023 RepID=UPI0023073DC2|nr:uncharacterized protein LOC128389608 [Panonychus citri]